MRRTLPQNNALHKALAEVAQEMYMQDITMQVAVNKLKVGVRPTKEGIKELLFKPAMMAMYPDKKSTTELTTVEMQKLWEAFSEDFLQDRLNIHVQWPSEEL